MPEQLQPGDLIELVATKHVFESKFCFDNFGERPFYEGDRFFVVAREYDTDGYIVTVLSLYKGEFLRAFYCIDGKTKRIA